MTPHNTLVPPAEQSPPFLVRKGGIATSTLKAVLGRPQRVPILMYHRIQSERAWLNVTPEAFAQQMQVIREVYQPVPLSQVVECLRQSRPLPPRAIVVTFDDGYRDNYLYAYPVLRALGIPATFFITSGHVETQRPFWWDRVQRGLKSTAEILAAWPDLWDVLPGCSREKEIEIVTAAFKEQEHRDALQLLDAICHPVEQDAREVMNWEELRDMAAHGMEIGSHTVTHPILARQSLSAAMWEIQQSKETLERQLDRAVLHFAYPNGRPCDYSVELQLGLEEAGYLSACSSVGTFVTPHSSPFALERIGISGFDSPLRFVAKLAGLAQ